MSYLEAHTVQCKHSSLEKSHLCDLLQYRRQAIAQLPCNVSELQFEQLQNLIIERRNALYHQIPILCNSKKVRFITP